MSEARAHVIFKGRVQGIGFRFTVERVARDLKIRGWVKNLFNGSVEVVAEAKREVLDDFLDKIRSYFKRYIQEEVVDFSQPTGEFRDFTVLF